MNELGNPTVNVVLFLLVNPSTPKPCPTAGVIKPNIMQTKIRVLTHTGPAERLWWVFMGLIKYLQAIACLTYSIGVQELK